MDVNQLAELEQLLDGAIDELTKKIIEVLTDGAHIVTIYNDGNKETYLEFHDGRAEKIFLKLIADANNGNEYAQKIVELFHDILFKKAETM